MSQARCTFQVQGLDCQVEVDALSASLLGAPGVQTLGFDLIHGTMTVDYQPNFSSPESLAELIAKKAGMTATIQGAPVDSGGDKASVWKNRWTATAASGLALFAGVLCSANGMSAWWTRGFYAAAVLSGGIELFPKAIRGLRQFRLDIHVLMGLAVVSAMVLGQWDEAATVAFLFGLSEALEGLSLDRARRAVRELLELTPQRRCVTKPRRCACGRYCGPSKKG